MTQVSRDRAGGFAGRVRVARGSALHPGFAICTITLVVLLAGFAAATWNVRLQKRECPLRKPLSKLDALRLSPYVVPPSPSAKQTLHSDTVEALQTDQYIQWVLEDMSIRDDGNPTKRAVLFITYYTGQPDPVPHIPEVCYLGSGYDVAVTEDHELKIPELDRTVPVRVLEFKKAGGERHTVLYTFHTNGQFAVGRNQVRSIIGNPFEEYAYFCKVELAFQSRGGQYATRAELAEAGTKLFRRLLPLLIEEHWPDWAALHDKAARPSAPASAAATRAAE